MQRLTDRGVKTARLFFVAQLAASSKTEKVVVDMSGCFNIDQGSSGRLGGSCFSATGRAQRGLG
jgi:hypothetical protein